MDKVIKSLNDKTKMQAYYKKLNENNNDLNSNNPRYYVNRHSDLSNKQSKITVKQMNYIIKRWSEYTGYTPFLGQGKVFIDASKKSGLDPIYILSNAAW